MRLKTLILVIISIFFLGCNTTPKPVDNKTPTEQELKEQKEKQEQEAQKKKLEEEQRQKELQERQERETMEAAARAAARLSNNVQKMARVRVNQEIVEWIEQLKESGEDIERLIFYLDKSFTLEIEEKEIHPLVDIANDGMLVINAPVPLPPINFSDIEQGKIKTFSPQVNETFLITTDAANKKVAMRFRKNAQHDYYYELFSMVIDDVNYKLVPHNNTEGFPMLYIYASIDEKIRDVRVYEADFLAVLNGYGGIKDDVLPPQNKPEIKDTEHPHDTALSEETVHSADPEKTDGDAPKKDEIAQHEDAITRLEKAIELHEQEISGLDGAKDEIVNDPDKNTSVTQAPKTPTPPAVPPAGNVNSQNEVKQTQTPQQNIRNPNYNLIGSGTLQGDTVFNFIKNKLRTRNPLNLEDNEIRNIIVYYIQEARDEEINHDIAIAQMLYMTVNLTNPIYVRTFNYAGLTPVPPNQAVNFPSSQIGVRAHIQQLRGYAKSSLKTRNAIVTPRWNMISDFRGTITTLEELSTKWASDSVNYRESIEKKLKELYEFAAK